MELTELQQFVVDKLGRQIWCNSEGKYHRTDGPAVIWASGTKCWYINGKLHREDGPAVTFTDGSTEYWVNDSLHRTDGPAIIRSCGLQEWYVNGKRKIKNSSYQKAAKLTNEDMLMINLKYGDVK